MNACQLEIGLKVKNIIVNTDCHFETDSDNHTFVVSDMSLDLT